jgi:selenocysteine lyase/cysteine desulfurase
MDVGEARVQKADDPEKLIATINASVIGEDEVVDGPFGPRRVTYADYTASGRALSFIEEYIREAVLPLYANTHTESSGTGLQTTRFREEARQIVRKCTGATDDHVVLFAGSGTTGAIDKLVNVLGIRLPSNFEDRHDVSEHIAPEERPVIFIGPYEHHSNELPWRESIGDVVTIHEDADGHIDLEHLAEELERHADRTIKIGSFSAASNVTGVLTDVGAVSTLLHEHGALAFWDFAAAAPYVRIQMNPDDGNDLNYYDAIFISPHKMIGGPGTPGLLIARKDLFDNRVPATPGGGTVAYVNPEEHVYLSDIEHREEGGTPAIIESIRCGLAFQLKAAVGTDVIRDREEDLIQRAIERWQAHPNIEILGNPDLDRLSIVSFVVRHESRYLHHNFVVALLNDLFGVQSRGGCSCAGPYGHRLLGIDLDRSHEFEREIVGGCEGIKPGWVRVNFNYFITEVVFDFIVSAVEFVAAHGFHFLPFYRFDPLTGLWVHRTPRTEPPMSLFAIDYSDGSMEFPHRRQRASESDLRGYLAEAHEILETLTSQPRPEPFGMPDVSEDFEALRWFPFPDEIERETPVTP